MRTATLLSLFLLAVAAPTAMAVDAPRQDTLTTSYEVGGVRVIHRFSRASDVVAVNLYLLGGAAQLDEATAGVELMLLGASEFGTAGYPGRETRLALARTGSRIVSRGEADWTVFGFRGLTEEFETTWAVFADRLMRPAIDSVGLETVRARMVVAARARSTHPDARLRALAGSIAFADHAYRHPPGGTEASLAQLDRAALLHYHETQFVTSRMLLVVVGNVGRERVEAAVQTSLAGLPRGNYEWRLPPVWSAPRPSVTVVDEQLPTNYVLGYFAGPQSDSRDYHAFRIATQLLGGFAAYEIRNKGISYAAYSPILDEGATTGGVYVTAVRPQDAIDAFNEVIEALREGHLNRSVLVPYLTGIRTRYYYENETFAEQADFLARHELMRGDWRSAGNYLRDVRAVTPAAVRNAARRYFRNIQYVYIGNPRHVPRQAMTRY